MARTRSMLVRAAAGVVADRGTRRASMTDIAAAAGVAKGTLYNHFRTKDDVWSALVEAELSALVEECRGLPLVVALGHAARRIGAHPAIRGIAADEPAILAALLAPDGRYWTVAREAVTAVLTSAGKDPAGADLVLRWLASHLAAPDPGVGSTAELLAAMLPPFDCSDDAETGAERPGSGQTGASPAY